MYLLSGSASSMPTWQTALYMVVLGLGLGMTMQVLVLAAQNAVPYEHLGVATSGSTLFRQVGGSIGVSLFGAIFANRLAANLADALPPGIQLPAAASPKLVAQLPPARPRVIHRRFRGGAEAGLRRRGGSLAPGLPAHLAAARGASPQERSGGGRRRKLRDATRGGVAARAGTDRGHPRAPREPLARLRAGSPSAPGSISTRPSCGCLRGWGKGRPSTSAIRGSLQPVRRFASGA